MDASSSRGQAGALVDDYYAKHYVNVHGSGSVGAAHRFMHQRLERGRSNMRFPITLELGAGNLEHYPFVRHWRERYIATDLRYPTHAEVVEAVRQGQDPSDLSFHRADAMRLPYADRSVDRIIAGCLAVHLPDPLAAAIEWQRACRLSGIIDFLVPCDPGFVSRGFRRLVSERAAKHQGVKPHDYRTINAIEHISPFGRVAALVRAGLEPGRELKINYYPVPFLPSWNLNAFAVFTIRPQ